jgi:hypothetical protein
VLVTSRNPAWGVLGQAVQVDVLERNEAVALLLRRTRDHDSASAAELADALGDLPLALEQAAAYLEQTGMPVKVYLGAYQRRRQRLLAKGTAVAYQGQVDTTWQLSIDQLSRTSPVGVELLRLCAFLAPEAIPPDLFTAKADVLPATLATAVTEDGELGVHEAAGACYRYSLVARDEAGIRVHRLVQAIVLAQLAALDRQALNTAVARLLVVAFPDEIDDSDRWSRCAQLLPHVLTVADHAQETEVAERIVAVMLRRRYLPVASWRVRACPRAARTDVGAGVGRLRARPPRSGGTSSRSSVWSFVTSGIYLVLGPRTNGSWPSASPPWAPTIPRSAGSSATSASSSVPWGTSPGQRRPSTRPHHSERPAWTTTIPRASPLR